MSANLISLKQIIDRASQGGLSETIFRAGISQIKQRHTLGKATPVTVGDDNDLVDSLLAAGTSPILHMFLFGWIRSQRSHSNGSRGEMHL